MFMLVYDRRERAVEFDITELIQRHTSFTFQSFRKLAPELSEQKSIQL